MSQTSSLLSQTDSYTGRSAELLLPSGDTGKRRHDSGHDAASHPRADRYKAQVRASLFLVGSSAREPVYLPGGVAGRHNCVPQTGLVKHS